MTLYQNFLVNPEAVIAKRYVYISTIKQLSWCQAIPHWQWGFI